MIFLTKTQIEVLKSVYTDLNLSETERLLETWLSDDWSKSPYRNYLAPALIQRKLELNEAEYENKL